MRLRRQLFEQPHPSSCDKRLPLPLHLPRHTISCALFSRSANLLLDRVTITIPLRLHETHSSRLIRLIERDLTFSAPPSPITSVWRRRRADRMGSHLSWQHCLLCKAMFKERTKFRHMNTWRNSRNRYAHAGNGKRQKPD